VKEVNSSNDEGIQQAILNPHHVKWVWISC